MKLFGFHFDPEGGGSTFLENAGVLPQEYTTLNLGRENDSQ
jgi:hypothetical protein